MLCQDDPACVERWRRRLQMPPPGRWQRARCFLVALWRHLRQGMPQASPEDQARRLAICSKCQWFDAQLNSCRQCGCKLRHQPGSLADKIGWAAERCPLFGNRPGPWWGPVAGEKIWRRLARHVGEVTGVLSRR